MVHSKSGENLCTCGSPDRPFAVATDMWIEEKGKYWGQPVDQNYVVYGHYTQVIWPDTTKVGIATARNGDFVIVVAHYDPVGNFLGRSAY